jgi:DNA-binding NtrC family response regulator
VPVLITGPNGAGKEQVAEMVQANSRRKDRPFVKVNCGGLPDQLLEAELFGAEAGAYTGATKLRVGRFEEAHGGTLFLDEIGNLSMAGQAKLLRVLQLGEYQRLGSGVTRKVDVRVISATNVNLPRAIQEGTFREDLYFRLAVIEVGLPALKDRPEDVPLLAEHFLARYQPGGEEVKLGAGARQALLAHDWPGNVRELQNRIQRAVLVRKGATLEAADLGLSEGGHPVKSAAEPPPAAAPLSADEAAERAAVEQALAEARGVVSRAAAQLGLSRQAFYRRLERLGLSVERRLKG